MTINEVAVQDLLSLAEKHSYIGTGKDISTLSIGIAESSDRLTKAQLAEARIELEKVGISSKVFSKLKIIGRQLLMLGEAEREQVIKALPASYGTIHVLCGMKPHALLTAVKTGRVKRSMSIRLATIFVKEVKYPKLLASGGSDKGRQAGENEDLFRVVGYSPAPLEASKLQELESELKATCERFGVELFHARASTAEALKREARGVREAFWRSILAKNLSEEWFEERSEVVRKQFNLKNVQELLNAPLRSFTGFLQVGGGGKIEFWDKHGKNYIAKVHLEMEKSEDNAQRYNLRRRLDEVLGERRELAQWTNITLKESGFM